MRRLQVPSGDVNSRPLVHGHLRDDHNDRAVAQGWFEVDRSGTRIVAATGGCGYRPFPSPDKVNGPFLIFSVVPFGNWECPNSP